MTAARSNASDAALLELLPIFAKSLGERRFNLFDVMHHGRHEKQLSNVFAWLLDEDETHALGNQFQQIFLARINSSVAVPIDEESFRVDQEVNTAPPCVAADVADIVLTGQHAVIVVENYYTSSGHGHSYYGYKNYGETGEENHGKRSIVALLSQFSEESLLKDGWEDAARITYSELLGELWTKIIRDSAYQRLHPEPFAFIRQLHDKFSKERNHRMDDEHLIEFVKVMCETGQAERYGMTPYWMEDSDFDEPILSSFVQHYNESRELLKRVKDELKRVSRLTLIPRLNERIGEEKFISAESSTWQGIYLWTVKLETEGDEPDTPVANRSPIRLKFGPSAWSANNGGGKWDPTTEWVDDPDYSRLFIQLEGVVHQSQVTVRDVLGGLEANDSRLADEVIGILGY